jgi:hypothetical protein
MVQSLEMDDQEIVGLLQEFWPMEAKTAGPTYLAEIAGGNSDFAEVEGAAHIGIPEVIALLIAAAEFIRVLTVLLRPNVTSLPTLEETEKLVHKRGLTAPKLTAEQQRRLITQILKYLGGTRNKA